MKKLGGIIALFLLVAGTISAQAPAPKPLRLGIGLLGTSYAGDLTVNSSPLERFSAGASLSLQFASEKLISPQLNGGFGRFTAQDRDIEAVDGIQPNTFVETPFFFVDLRLKARFLREKGVHPYLSVGIGMLGYTPRDGEGNNLLDNYSSRQDGETYGSISANFPLSAGLEIRFSPILNLGLEYTMRATTTDFLDNISALGQKEGNDKLHSLLLSLYLTFDPDHMFNAPLRGRDR